MDPFTLAIIGSTGLQVYGNFKANMDEAEAEAQNLQLMREQSELIKKSTEREKAIYNRASLQEVASIDNAFASSGIRMDGTALAWKQQQEFIRMQEMEAIELEGRMNLRSAMLKISSTQDKISNLRSFDTNALQAGTTILGGASQLASRNNTETREKAKSEE